MKATLFPTLTETLELHKALLERSGGKAGIRDMGLLESALMRPQTGYGESFKIETVIQKKASIEVIAGWLEKHMKSV